MDYNDKMYKIEFNKNILLVAQMLNEYNQQEVEEIFKKVIKIRKTLPTQIQTS